MLSIPYSLTVVNEILNENYLIFVPADTSFILWLARKFNKSNDSVRQSATITLNNNVAFIFFKLKCRNDLFSIGKVVHSEGCVSCDSLAYPAAAHQMTRCLLRASDAMVEETIISCSSTTPSHSPESPVAIRAGASVRFHVPYMKNWTYVYFISCSAMWITGFVSTWFTLLFKII